MPNKETLLVVDDEPEICKILSKYFTDHGYNVHRAQDAMAAREIFEQHPVDLALLDICMPGEDGLSLTRWIREKQLDCGVVMVTSEADVVDRVIGLEIGADDYVSKPFDLRELLARVKSVLRRREKSTQRSDQAKWVTFGKCYLDFTTCKLYDNDGNEQSLTTKEYELLKIFAERPNRVLNRDQIMELAHNKDWEVYDRSIDLRIMRLRRKVEPNPEKPAVIKTVRGMGYIFVNP